MNKKHREVEQTILVEMCVVGLLFTVVTALVVPLTFRASFKPAQLAGQEGRSPDFGSLARSMAFDSGPLVQNRAISN
jgi:hypothetical protein